MDTELSHTAFHEAGHAVAAVTAFKDARWLPNPPPSPVVLSVEVTDNEGQFLGNCTAMNIFSTKWARALRLATLRRPDGSAGLDPPCREHR